MEIALITGASSGIGKAVAQALSSKYFVAACVRNKKDFSYWDGKKNIYPFLLDVTNEESILSTRTLMEKQFSKHKLHLINNAGIVVSGPIETTPIAEWQKQFEVNVFGLLRVTQAFLPWIRHTKGRIINIGSVSGLAAAPFLAPYSASKYALESISDALRRELLGTGVNVSLLEPGPIATPIWEKNFSHADSLLAQMPPDARNVYEKNLRSFLLAAQKSADSAVSTDMVCAKVFDALTATKPKTRYLVGKPNLVIETKIAKFLPDRFIDKLIAKQFGR